jgi:hypothetical protein
MASLSSQCGYIDAQGEVIIPFQYSAAFNFNGGLARVVQDGKHGYINKIGEYIWQPTK